MFLLKFLILALVASLCFSSTSQSFLLYASEKGNSIDFYETDFQLNNPRKFLTINTGVGELNNLLISPSAGKKVMYWKYDGSTSVYRYDLDNNEQVEMEFSEESNSAFIGLGIKDQLYLYSPETKLLKVYDFKTGNKLSQIESLKDVQTDMHCVDVDPRYREQLFFAECSKSGFRGKVLDVNLKALQSYSQSLPKCFDTWRITPDAKKVYAVHGKNVYLSDEEGGAFRQHHKAGTNILGLAVGNNEVFYSTEQGKLVKLNNGSAEKEISIPATVKKMALLQ